MSEILTAIIRNYKLLVSFAISLIISSFIVLFYLFLVNAVSSSSNFPYLIVNNIDEITRLQSVLIFVSALFICALLMFFDILKSGRDLQDYLTPVRNELKGNWNATYQLEYMVNNAPQTFTFIMPVRFSTGVLQKLSLEWDLSNGMFFNERRLLIEHVAISLVSDTQNKFRISYYLCKEMKRRDNGENIEVETFLFADFEKTAEGIETISGKWFDLNGHIAALMTDNNVGNIPLDRPLFGEIGFQRIPD